MGRQFGYVGHDVQDVEQSCICINLTVAVYVVGIIERGVGMSAGMGKDIEYLLSRQVGFCLKPKGNGASYYGCGHRGAALCRVIVGFASIDDFVGQLAAYLVGDAYETIVGCDDAHAWSNDVRFYMAVERRALRRESGYLTRYQGVEGIHFVIRPSIDVAE